MRMPRHSTTKGNRRVNEFSLDKTPLTLSDTNRILATSEGLGWADIAAVVKKDDPQECYRRPVSSLWIAFPLAPADITRTVDGSRVRVSENDGKILLNRPKREVKDTIARSSSTFHLFLHEAVLDEVASERLGGRAEDMDWDCDVLADDETLLHFMKAVVLMLREGEGTAWRSGYLARAIAAHLVDRHAKPMLDLHDETIVAPLSAIKMAKIREFMQTNIEGRFKYSELAALMGLSRTAFFDRFSQTVNQTPHQYMQSIRIEKAKALVSEGELSLVETAAACGFSDQSHMARAFRQHVGVTPSRFRATKRYYQ